MDNTEFAMIGGITNAALYLSFLALSGLALQSAPVLVLSIASMGIATLGYQAQLFSQTHWLTKVLVLGSQALGAASGIALICKVV